MLVYSRISIDIELTPPSPSANNKTLLFTKPWIQKFHQTRRTQGVQTFQHGCRYLNFDELCTHRMGMEAFNSSLLTMKFEEWPRRNVSSSNLEILPDLSPLENLFVIFLGFPISSLPSFPSLIILLKFRQCRFGSIRIFVFLAHLPPWFPEESKVISRLERGQDSIRRGLRGIDR